MMYFILKKLMSIANLLKIMVELQETQLNHKNAAVCITTQNQSLSTRISMAVIRMPHTTQLLLGPRHHNQLRISCSHMDCYDYNNNIQYWDNMFPTRSPQGSRKIIVHSHYDHSHMMSKVISSHHVGST